MEEEGNFGNFFPAHLNPYYFNDTAASLIGDFTKEEVTADGFLRRDEEIKVDIPTDMDMVTTEELSEFENYHQSSRHSGLDPESFSIDPSILTKIITDQQGNYYRIIPMELKFLQKYNLPLPRQHWFDRLKQHFSSIKQK